MQDRDGQAIDHADGQQRLPHRRTRHERGRDGGENHDDPDCPHGG
jgi:hypothetical protein